MTNTPSIKDSSSKTGLLRRADQVVIATILSFSLFSMLVYWFHLGGQHGHLIEIDSAESIEIEYRVDINQAEWPELAQLPGIGKTLALRIVESRNIEGPYIDHNDIRRVRGIGNITLIRIEPYLLPIPPSNNVAGP